jgi:hypothetical protein
LAGILLLLQNLGLISVNIWGIIWPLVLILIGVEVLLSVTGRGGRMESQHLSLPLNSASQATIQLNHGAGMLQVDASAEPGALVSGTFDGGVEVNQSDQGMARRIELRPARQAFWDFPWGMGGYSHGFGWNVGLAPEVPLSLEVKTGASETNLNLARLKVLDLKLETGASATHLYLPESAGVTQGRINCGVASVDIHLPEQVGARIQVKSGLAGINVNPGRFNRMGDTYETQDYLTAVNKVNLFIETGVGSVNVA